MDFEVTEQLADLDTGLFSTIKSGKCGVEILFDPEIGESDMARLDVYHIELIPIKKDQWICRRDPFADQS